MFDPAYPGVNITATNTIYHSQAFPSYFDLPVVSKHQLPQIHGIQAEFEAAYPQIDYKMVVEKGPAILERFSLMRMGEGN